MKKLVLFLLLIASPVFAQRGSEPRTYIGIGGSPVSPAIQASVSIPLLSKSDVTITGGYHWQDTTKHDILFNAPPLSEETYDQVQEKPALFALVGLQTMLNDGIFVGGAVGVRHFSYTKAEYTFKWELSPKTKTEFDYSASVGYRTSDWGLKGEYNPHRLFAIEILFAIP